MKGGIQLELEKVLTFNLSGNELMKNRYNLHYLTEGLSLSKRLLEQSYLTTVNKSRMSKSDRELFKIYINEVREGSFETDILIFMKTVSATLITGYSGMNPNDIWLLTINSIKYLRLLFQSNKKGEKIKVEIINSPNSVVNYHSDGNVAIIKTNHDVIECANAIESTVRKSLDMIDDVESVTSFNLFEKDEPETGLSLDIEDKKLFNNEPVLDDVVVEFIGKIETANFINMNGKIKVIDAMSSGLHNHDYTFSFVDPIPEDLFRKSCSSIVNVKALKKVKFNTTTLEKDVVSLRVISFKM